MRCIINLDDLPVEAAQRVLFERLYQHLDEDDWYLPLSRRGARFVAALRDDIFAGRPIAYDKEAWRGLFKDTFRDGESVRPLLAPQLGLINFIVQLRDDLKKIGPKVVPLSEALMMMAGDGNNYIDVMRLTIQQHMAFKITPEGEEALDLRGSCIIIEVTGTPLSKRWSVSIP